MDHKHPVSGIGGGVLCFDIQMKLSIFLDSIFGQNKGNFSELKILCFHLRICIFELFHVFSIYR
jgi:hypothetical protein